MALVSRDLFRNWWDEMDRYHRDLEEHFKRLSTVNDMWQMPPMPSFQEYFRPWKNMIDQLDQLEHQVGGTTTVERDQDKYRVVVDVQQFAPEEITVRTDDKCITIEGKHEEKKDQHGYISRQFVRRYALPQGYDIGHVKPSLSSDGILTITAPRLALPAPGERIIPIERSNAPAIKAT
ncbi:protein lethal(2)essential for life [Ptiloglossa arizonensis]|uniref:protein lethal(2)essential for life n=1 Tax=Ptiloglossa arizonensis TaxID=3350558 RepID=UPI003F9FFB1D